MQRFPFNPRNAQEAIAAKTFVTNLTRDTQYRNPEYDDTYYSLLSQHNNVLTHAEYGLTRRPIKPETKRTIPPKPRSTADQNSQLSALLTRFVLERITSAREKPPAMFITPEYVKLDAVTLGEPETITLYIDPRVMRVPPSAVRVYSSCNQLQLSAKLDTPLIRLSVRFLPNVEGNFRGSVVILVGHRRTVVPIEAYVQHRQIKSNPSPLLLFQPLKVPRLPIETCRIPPKAHAQATVKSYQPLGQEFLDQFASRLYSESYDAYPTPIPVLNQSPTITNSVTNTTRRALTNKFSLSVGAITTSDSEYEPTIAYQTRKEPPRHRSSSANILLIRKDSFQQKDSVPSHVRKALDDSDDFHDIFPQCEDDTACQSHLPASIHSCEIVAKYPNMEADPAFSAPESCLNSTQFVDNSDDLHVPAPRDLSNLLESIVDLNDHNVSAQETITFNLSPSPQYSFQDTQQPSHQNELAIPLTYTQRLPDSIDHDSSTNWGSITTGEDSDESTLALEVLKFNLSEEELQYMERFANEWNVFSQFDTTEEIDITDGGVIRNSFDASNWHRSRCNLLADLTYMGR